MRNDESTVHGSGPRTTADRPSPGPGAPAAEESAPEASIPEVPAPGTSAHAESAPGTSTATTPPVPHDRDAPVAVIGVACRLPGADGPEAFWELLRSGHDSVRELPAGRRSDGAPAVAGYLDRIDTFDPEFFGISPREAAATDPQQRLLLELGWEALENAGTLPAALRGSRTAVLAAAIWDDYAELTHGGGPDALTHHSFTGTRRAMLANRLSHTLGLTGPSLTVDTGQSSSLVAVHLACELLRTNQATTALVGGVNLIAGPGSTAASQRMGALSPTGRCHTFDERADGYVRGEGGAVLVLKPLDLARADGDRVLGVIRGSAVNNDGGGDALGVPRRETQEDVLRLAHRRAGTDPADLHYVELHGTGTPVGDPVEAAALGAALGTRRPDGDPLTVGSVKTNIGHLEGAAGIVGLLKVLLSAGHREIPPTLHHVTPNPRIPLDALNLRVQTGLTPWPDTGRTPLAGVSSFGLGGTNCHVVVEGPIPAPEKPTPAEPAPASGRVLWPLSATGPAALRAQAARLRDHLARHPDAAPADIGHSLATTRTAFRHRAVACGDDLDRLTAAVTALAEGLPDPDLVMGAPAGSPSPVFVFPGQGAQWSRMGLELADAFPVFDDALRECADALAPFGEWDLRAELAGDLARVDVVQPVSWAVMVSLARLWESFGVVPAAVVGHSQGEIAAAVIAGALSLEDAARIVAERSRVIGERLAGRGGMASIALPAATVREQLQRFGDRLAVAAVNGPSSTVVSGEPSALDELLAALEAEEVRVRRIAVDYASHSSHVESIREELLDVLAPITPRPATVPFYSTVTGSLLDTQQLDAAYWVRNLRQTVEFEATTKALIADGLTAFVECSAHPVLAVGIQDSGATAVIGSLKRNDGGRDRFLAGAAAAWASGLTVAADMLFHRPGARRRPLPTYAFQRESHWLRAAGTTAPTTPPPAAGPLTETAPAPDATLTGTSAAALAGRTPQQQRRALLDLVRRHAAAVLGHTDATHVEDQRTFKDTGFDSHMSLELQQSLSRATGLALPSGVLFSHPTPEALTDRIHQDLLGTTAPGTHPDADAPGAKDDAVAVVGMACRFPGGVASPEDLWHLVAEGADAIGPFPTDRGWDLDALYHPDPEHPGTSYVRKGGFLDGAGDFDAPFFGISPREARTMDPQQRLLLETSWEAVERAGILPGALRGTPTGVFAGAMAMEYGTRLHEAPQDFQGQMLTGTAGSVLSGRVSYGLGLRGPAVTVDTACSSSLVALHLAAQALRQGDCSLALAGGVTVMPHPGMFLEFSRQRGLSADGRCKAFGSGADGTGWAEGVGVVVLERLADARRNGHRVLAVLRGSAVNQDGASNGLTAPNGDAQQQVIRQALRGAGLTPDDVDAVEAHGTGTRLGDPIEAQALLATYGSDRDPEHPLRLGSLKSNIGHAQAAAGVGGVIKTVMALHHRTLPKTLHADEPSPYIDWDAGAVSLLTEAAAWPDRGRPRRAAVSSFGISGTNAHVILEEAPPGPDDGAAQRRTDAPVAWSLSARTAPALAAQARRLHTRLSTDDAPHPADTGLSLATTRAALDHRAVLIGDGPDELLPALAALADGAPAGTTVTGTVGSTAAGPVFVFPGQGAQWSGMGRELAAAFPVFDDSLDACARALAPYTDWDLRAELAGDLSRVDVLQPATWAVMVSLARLWQSFGVTPAAVVGHSQGEIAAAVVAGALSLEDGARVVAERSRIIRRSLAGRGGMASVALPADTVRARLAEVGEGLEVAAVNGPRSTVVSGDPAALDRLLALFEPEDVRVRRIAVDYASHSSHVDSVRDELLEVLAPVRPRSGDVPFHSTVTGEALRTTELDAAYWVRNLRRTVEFTTAVEGLAADGHSLFVEMSPHPVLTMAVEETADDSLSAVGSLRRDDGGPRRFLTSLAEAHVRGADIDWAPVFPGAHVVDLPTYAFQHRHHWLDGATARPAVADHPLAATVERLADGDGALLTGLLSRSTAPWIQDHAVAGDVLLPGTAFVELLLRAGEQVGCARLEDLTLQAPLPLPGDGSAVRLQISVREPEEGTGSRPFTVHTRPAGSAPDSPWTRHATGTLAPARATAQAPDPGLTSWPPPDSEPVALEKLYGELASLGYEYGPAFRGLTAAWRHGRTVYAEVALPAERHPEAAGYGIHPALLDACLHAALLDRVDTDAARPALPFAWSGVELHATGATAARVRIVPAEPGSDTVAVTVADAGGQPLAEVEALVLREAPAATGPADALPEGLYRVTWTPAPGTTPTPPGEWCAYGDELPDPVPPTVVARVQAGPDVADAVNHALRTVQRWLADERCARSRLVLAVRGDTPAEAAAAGFIRSARTEHPGRFVLVHLPADASDADAAAAAAGDEPEIRAGAGGPTVPRLARVGADGVLAPPAEGPWRLDVTEPGNLALLPSPAAARPLAPGEVRVRMAAAGLNFRDVVVSLGMVPGLEGVGVEGAGVVAETGPGVTRLAVGDRVMGLLPEAMAPLAVADARTLVRVPDGWSLRRAASVPVAFLTAELGLVEGAGLGPGDRVLIHTATGGLGLAALQLARRAGAEVFATASPGKHALLRELGLDDDHIASSRDLGFRERFLDATGGAGLDVVMNTLSGEFTDASLDLLPRGGRFVEMGKTDIRDPGTVAADHPGVDYLYFDLLAEAPDRIRDGLDRLAAPLADGDLTPPLISGRDIRHAPEAFDTLRAATHLGKIVLTLPHTWDADRTVLVTGGTGTLGRLLARHLVTRHGVRHLLLTSRRGPDAEGAGALVDELRERGAHAAVVACDAADRDALAALLAGIPADRPLGAVVHTAGLLDDATVETMTPAQVERVLRAKVRSAELLDELTAGIDLDAFVLFSSVAGVLGTAGQANYAAANAALDALATRRRRQGRAAVSVAWGLWEQSSGMTGHLDGQDIGRLARTGTAPLASADGLALFDAALAVDEPGVVATRLDHAVLREQSPSALPAVLRTLAGTGRRRATAPAPGGESEEATLARRLADAAPEERRHTLLELVRTQTATVLRLSGAHEVEDERPFREVGFDSLTAVELRNRINAATGLRLPSTVIFRHPTPAQLADRLHTELVPEQDTAVAATAVLADIGRLRTAVAGIAAEERAAVAEELSRLLTEVGGVEDLLGSAGQSDLAAATDDEMFALIDKELELE
ncbi:SDR family NAD(P)-dependent oxidoreductase [Streptomyces sp. NPDC045714]|uniref:type I polyketide synthase n=1 Tax=Streptomyces sp. NPDC045714 TaxID=3154913 RepID=UPI0033F2BC2E